LQEDQQRYSLNGLSADDLENELDRLWAELQDPESELSKEAERRGINVAELRPLKRDEAIKVKRGEVSGFALGMEDIILAFAAHGVMEVVKASWTHLLYPIIKRQFGHDALEHIS
jgi:hypothetical protein